MGSAGYPGAFPPPPPRPEGDVPSSHVPLPPPPPATLQDSAEYLGAVEVVGVRWELRQIKPKFESSSRIYNPFQGEATMVSSHFAKDVLIGWRPLYQQGGPMTPSHQALVDKTPSSRQAMWVLYALHLLESLVHFEAGPELNRRLESIQTWRGNPPSGAAPALYLELREVAARMALRRECLICFEVIFGMMHDSSTSGLLDPPPLNGNER